jgi:hypothetical protein
MRSVYNFSVATKRLRFFAGANVFVALLLACVGNTGEAFADSQTAPIIGATQLSPGAVTNIQDQIQAVVEGVNSKKLIGADRDAAIAAAVAQIMIQSVRSYGANNTGQIASVILASTAVPLADIGSGLGQAAAQMAANNFGIGKATAQAVADEGNASAVGGCAHAAEQAGSHDVAKICEGPPTVTGSTIGSTTGSAGSNGAAGFGLGGVGANIGIVPPAAPPPACSGPSCT